MSDGLTESNDQTVDSSIPTAHGQFKPLRIWPPLLLLAVLVMLWWLLLSRATTNERCIGFFSSGVAFAVTLLLAVQSNVIVHAGGDENRGTWPRFAVRHSHPIRGLFFSPAQRRSNKSRSLR